MSDTTSVNNLTPHTFTSTGVSVFIRPIPPYLLRAVGKAFEPPKPPMETIAQPDGSTREEPNRSHPDYLTALDEHNARISEASTDLVVERGVVIQLSDEQRDEVRALRAFMRERFGVEIGDNDESAYVKHVAIGTPGELTELIRAVSARSVPTDPKSASG